MPKIKLDLPANGWRPRPYQGKAWSALKGGTKRVLLVWHRRAGKDDVCLHWTALAAMTTRAGSYWHMLPEASQARKAVWDAVNSNTGKRRIDEAFPKEIRAGFRDHDMSIRFHGGATWQVVGSDNFHSLIGSPPAGIVFSEWARADPQAWAYLRPILVENDGWAIFVTTPFGRNHAAKMFDDYGADPNWFVERLTVDDTQALDARKLATEREEMLRDYGPAVGAKLFDQEYYCSFDSPVVGSYYADLMSQVESSGRLTTVPFDPAMRVETWWDLGYSDATAVWFVQRSGLQIRLIDYYEASGAGLEHYAKVLTQKAQAGNWIYGEHVWPHDGGAGDIATGRTRNEIMASLGYKPIILPRHDVDDGIQAARSILPMCIFDKEKCTRGIEALRLYRAEWDETLRALRQKPLHDWTSHAADAFRYGAMHKPSSLKNWARSSQDMAPKLAIA